MNGCLSHLFIVLNFLASSPLVSPSDESRDDKLAQASGAARALPERRLTFLRSCRCRHLLRKVLDIKDLPKSMSGGPPTSPSPVGP